MHLPRILFCLLLVSPTVSLGENPRVFVTDSKSWEISGGFAGTSEGFAGGTSGGARPQTAEIIKTFGEKCSGVTINNRAERADYVVLLDHEGGKGWIRKDNKVAVFNREGDSIVSKSTRSLGGSVETACGAILKDWAGGGAERAATAQKQPAATASAPAPTPAAPAASIAKVDVSSEPSGADIEVDGAFVGSTPSTLELAPGEHVISVKKSGYKAWERKLKITGGSIRLHAELEKNQ
ncbi:MAG TPA: PEGA domain-containing protein [Terriglobales bacterium]|nr:PEGA domain-containing protein [Terriglobales bacterium]